MTFIFQITVWAMLFAYWLSFLGSVRSMGLFYALMVFCFMFSTLPLRASLILVILVSLLYVGIAALCIRVLGQEGSLFFEIQMALLFAMVAAYLSYMGAQMRNRGLALTGSQQQLRKNEVKLMEAVHQLEKIASTDFLTGLLTRRAATEAIEKDRRKPEGSSDQPQILALCDLDNFKMINDTHGHEVGDQVLQATGQRIASVLRQGDILARWGGEEFLVVLRSATLQNAEEALERVRMSVAATPVRTERASVDVTTSIGFAVLASDSNIEEIINEADICLYAAKAAGRNCVFSEAERLRRISTSPSS